jgi:hypothetical protein
MIVSEIGHQRDSVSAGLVIVADIVGFLLIAIEGLGNSTVISNCQCQVAKGRGNHKSNTASGRTSRLRRTAYHLIFDV